MNDYGISKRTYDLLLKNFRDFPEVEQVVLFGSRAKGNYKAGSDIDLAVKGKEVTPALIFKLNNIFNERLPIPYEVDVIGYQDLDHESLRDHIDRIGILIYNSPKEHSAIIYRNK